MYNSSMLLLFVTKISKHCNFFLSLIFFVSIKIFRSELDDNQIQELFQQLIPRLIFYSSMNFKQISTKLTIAVRRIFKKNFHIQLYSI